jgi:hypothetical protein
MKVRCYLLLAAIVAGSGSTALADDDAEALAKSLANPLAPMVSVPFVVNADFGQGPSGDGVGYTANIQPVIPFEISSEWNLISRTVLPLKYMDNVFADDIFGLGDTTQSFFFSPIGSDLIWGIGPAFLLPTATDPLLGTGKWGAGPTGLALVQPGPWTVGVLANHLWSFAGDPARSDVSTTFIQPFVAYSIGGGRSVNTNIEASYDWVTGQWVAPLNLGYSQVFKSGEQTMNWELGGKVYLSSPAGGPDWGLHTGLTLLFPAK